MKGVKVMYCYDEDRGRYKFQILAQNIPGTRDRHGCFSYSTPLSKVRIHATGYPEFYYDESMGGRFHIRGDDESRDNSRFIAPKKFFKDICIALVELNKVYSNNKNLDWDDISVEGDF